MITGWVWLLGCLWLGECVAYFLNLPIPGSVIGMTLLLGLSLRLKGEPMASIRSVSTSIIPYLSLAILPASAGILNHMNLLKGESIRLVAVLVVSLILGMIATGGCYQWLSRMQLERKLKKCESE